MVDKKKKPAPDASSPERARVPAKPKAKKPRPISDNPAAGLALLHRARRGR